MGSTSASALSDMRRDSRCERRSDGARFVGGSASPDRMPGVQRSSRRPDVEGRQAKHTEEILAHFFHARHTAHDHGIVQAKRMRYRV